MDERAGSYKEYTNHFNLGEAHLRKIHSILVEYAAKLSPDAYVLIYIARENDSFYETRDLDKILADENTSGKAIKTLSLDIIYDDNSENLLSSSKKKKAVIGFTRDDDSKIRFMASHSSRDWCFLLIDELDTQVQRIIKNKPSFLAKFYAVDMVFAILVFTILFSVLAFSMPERQLDLQALQAESIDKKINFLVEKTLNQYNTTLILMPYFAVGVMLFLALIEFRPIKRLVKIMDMSTFYWGDMVKIYDAHLHRRSQIKWGVIIAFIVSLAASFVASWII